MTEDPRILVGSEPVQTAKRRVSELLPVRVSSFDDLITRKGLERGSTILLSGGAGSGKTTFCLQMLYEGAKRHEKGLYLSLEENVEKLKMHMLNNFGWDFYELEKKGLVAFLQLDALEIARSVEAQLLKEKEKLVIDFDTFELSFKPDRIVVDCLSALSIAFENSERYRKYIHYLFEKLESYNSVNVVLSETEQSPLKYSRVGIEEFLADGVIVLYNLKIGQHRQQALEILKLRSSAHEKKLVPCKMTSSGIEIYSGETLFE